MFFLTITFIVFVPAEGTVPLNSTRNLIPLASGNAEKERQVKNGQFFDQNEIKISKELVQINGNNLSDNLVEFHPLTPFGGLKPKAALLLSDKHNLSGEKLAIEASKPFGELMHYIAQKRLGERANYDEMKNPRRRVHIGNQSQPREKYQNARQQRFNETKLFTNKKYCMRRQNGERHQIRNQNERDKLPGDPVNYRRLYFPRESVNINSKNRSEELVYNRRRDHSGGPAIINRAKPPNELVKMTRKSVIEQERMQDEKRQFNGYGEPYQFYKPDRLGQPGEIRGRNRSSELINIDRENRKIANNQSGELIKNGEHKIGNRFENAGLRHPEEHVQSVKHNRPDKHAQLKGLKFTSEASPFRKHNLPGIEIGEPKPEELVRYGGPKPTGGSVLSYSQKHSKERVKFGEPDLPEKTMQRNSQTRPDELIKNRRIGKKLSSSGPKYFGERNETDKPAHSRSQKRPSDLVTFSGLRSNGGPLSLNGKKRAEEKVVINVQEIPIITKQPNVPTDPGELAMYRGIEPTGKILSKGGQQFFRERVKTDKPAQSRPHKRPSDLFTFEKLKLAEESLSSKGPKRFEERVEVGEPDLSSKTTQHMSQRHPDEVAMYKGNESTDKTSYNDGQNNFRERVETDKPVQPRAQNLPNDLVTFGAIKHMGERSQFNELKLPFKKFETDEVKPPDKLVQSNALREISDQLQFVERNLTGKRVDIGGSLGEPVQSDRQMSPNKLQKYRLVDVNRQTYLEQFSEPISLLKQIGLLNKKLFTQRILSRNDFGDRIYGRSAQIGEPYRFARPYERANVRGTKLNGLSWNNRFSDRDQIRQLFPRKRPLFNEGQNKKKIARHDHWIGEKNQFFNKRKQNQLASRTVNDMKSIFDFENQLVKNMQSVVRRKYREHNQSGEKIGDPGEKEGGSNRVVLIIPVPKGKGENMKNYHGVMEFLNQLFPNVFPI